MGENQLLSKVKNFLRVGDEDDALLVPLISAAKQYLLNAGVEDPENTEEGDGEQSLYELAVILYCHKIYYGNEDGLDRAMTGIILQIKDYSLNGGDD